MTQSCAARLMRTFWRAARRQVAWARADNVANLTHAQSHQRAVRQLAHAHGKIEMFIDEIQRPVRKHQPQIHARMRGEKLGCNRHDVQTSERHRRGDDELALRRLVFARRAALGFRQLLENPPARRRDTPRPPR